MLLCVYAVFFFWGVGGAATIAALFPPPVFFFKSGALPLKRTCRIVSAECNTSVSLLSAAGGSDPTCNFAPISSRGLDMVRQRRRGEEKKELWWKLQAEEGLIRQPAIHQAK